MKLLQILDTMDLRQNYQVWSMFFDKKTVSGARVSVNEQLAQDLRKPVIKKSEGMKDYDRFKDKNWVAKLAEMWSISSKNRVAKYLLCIIDVFTMLETSD